VTMGMRRAAVALIGAAMLAAGLGGDAWARPKQQKPCTGVLINRDPNSRFVGNRVTTNCSHNDTEQIDVQRKPEAAPSAQPSAQPSASGQGPRTVELTPGQFRRLCRAADFKPRICRDERPR
jgi:hypothetical protein